jgi:glycosyltransferase involved in cell wall biosynthesis
MSLLIEPVKWPKDNATLSEQPAVAVSVVVPVTERCDGLSEIYRVHAEVLNHIGRSFEFIFVIDAVFKKAGRQLESLMALREPIRIVTLSRPCGEATALMVGFEQARGEILLVLSSYFQVVPQKIEKILQKLDEGYDLVVTQRYPRVDSWINRIQTRGFHFLVCRLTGVELHDISCGLKGISRRVAREITLYGDLHRFLPMLAYQRGFRVAEVDIPQHPADARTRLYRPGVYLRRLLDILNLVFLFKFTEKPLRFFGLIGAGLFGGGFLISLVLAFEKIMGLTALVDRPLLILGVLSMVLGVQTGSIGLLGEIIIFTHADRARTYQIDRILDFRFDDPSSHVCDLPSETPRVG